MSYLVAVCKMNGGVQRCRYLRVKPCGFRCAKQSRHKALLDQLVADEAMAHRGDNCDGYAEDVPLNNLCENEREN